MCDLLFIYLLFPPQAEYIQYIKSIPSEEGKQAELALYKRQPNEAERILLQASPPLVYRAIMMNINSYRWSRALDIAVKYRSHVDTTLAYRMKFLEEFGKKETDNKFLQLASQVCMYIYICQLLCDKEESSESIRSCLCMVLGECRLGCDCCETRKRACR